MTATPVTVVHPQAGIRILLTRMLTSLGYEVSALASGEAAIEQAAGQSPDMILLSLDLPGLSGLETLRALRALAPSPEIVVTVGSGSAEAAAEAVRHGAFDIVTEPFELPTLGEILRAAHDRSRRQRGALHLEAVLRAHDPFPDIVGRSPGILRVLALVNKAAPTHSPVLIQGESGTGKELVARAVHAHSPRAGHPMIVVDCGALHDTLLESELFGHERGAFTGAHGLKHGLVETANGGTLFLDEIGEMSTATQAKVLRVLQSGEFRRLGSNRQIKADIRIIAATNKDLREEVRRGRFREDLYYRIAVIDIVMPSLRERAEDIPLLVEHFVRHSSQVGGRRLRFTPDAMDRLTEYRWPGNIRELRNVIERVAVLAESQVLSVDALPPAIARGAAPAAIPIGPAPDLPLAEVERRHILETLERHRWNKKRVATILGIDTKTLYNKLRRYGVPLGGRVQPTPVPDQDAPR